MNRGEKWDAVFEAQLKFTQPLFVLGLNDQALENRKKLNTGIT